MNLETLFRHVKGGAILSANELAFLNDIIVRRAAEPYHLSQAILSYCFLCAPNCPLADSIADLALEYVSEGGEDRVFAAEGMVMALDIYWHMDEKLYDLSKESLRIGDPKTTLLYLDNARLS